MHGRRCLAGERDIAAERPSPQGGWSREDGPRSRLAAASGSVASQTGPRKGARPGARRGQRWPGHDVRHGVMPPWPASAGRRRSDAVPRSSASRATGARPGNRAVGVVSRCRGPASPLVVPRGSPRVPGAAMPPGSPVGERQEVPPLVHSPLPRSRRPRAACPHRHTARPTDPQLGTHARHARSPERVRARSLRRLRPPGAMMGRQS